MNYIIIADYYNPPALLTRFPISSVPEGAIILDATLDWPEYTIAPWFQGACPGVELEVHRPAANWSQASVPPAAWNSSGLITTVPSSRGTAHSGTLRMDITSEVQYWVNGNENRGLLFSINGCEAWLLNDPILKPKVSITYRAPPRFPRVDLGGDGLFEWFGPEEVNQTTGPLNVNGTVLADALNAYLATVTAPPRDPWGNQLVPIPLNISSDNAAMIRLSNLSVVYDDVGHLIGYNGVSFYLYDELNELIANGAVDNHNNVTVPVKIASSNAGIINLSFVRIIYSAPFSEPGHSLLDFPSQLVPSGDLFTVVTEHVTLGSVFDLRAANLTILTSSGINPTFNFDNATNTFSESNDSLNFVVLDPDNSTITRTSDSTLISWKFRTTFNWSRDEKVGFEVQTENYDGQKAPVFRTDPDNPPSRHETNIQFRNFEVFRANNTSALQDGEWVGLEEPLRFHSELGFANSSELSVPDGLFSIAIYQDGLRPIGLSSNSSEGQYEIEVNIKDGFNYWNGVLFSAEVLNLTSLRDITPLTDRSINLKVDATIAAASMVSPDQNDTYLPLVLNQERLIRINITDSLDTGTNYTLHYWREGADDLDANGLPNGSEYQATNLTTGSGGPGTHLFTSSLNDSVNTNWQWISIYLSGNDPHGNPINGGGPGLENDLFSWRSRVDLPLIIENLTVKGLENNEPASIGKTVEFVVSITDPNTPNDITRVKIHLNPDGMDDLMLFWDRQSDNFSSSSNLVVINATESYIEVDEDAGGALDLHFIFNIREPLPLVDGYNDIVVEAFEVDSGGEMGHDRRFSNIWNYEDDIRITAYTLADITGITKNDLSSGDTVAGGDSVHAQLQLKLGNSQWNPVNHTVEVQMFVDGVLVAEEWNDENGIVDFSFQVPRTTNMDGARFEIILNHTLGGDVTSEIPLWKSIRVDANAPAVVDFQPKHIEVQDVDNTVISYTVLDQEAFTGLSTMNWQILDGGVRIHSGMVPLLPSSKFGDETHFFSLLDFTFGGVTTYNDSRLDQYEFQFWVNGSDDAGNLMNSTNNDIQHPVASIRLVHLIPDLAATTIAIIPGSPVVGDQVIVEVNITNYGEGTAGPFGVTLAVNGQEMGSSLAPSLARNETQAIALAWTVESAGTHQISVQVDSTDEIIEQDEQNNWITLTVTVGVSLQQAERGMALVFGSLAVLLLALFGLALALIQRRRYAHYVTEYSYDTGYDGDTIYTVDTTTLSATEYDEEGEDYAISSSSVDDDHRVHDNHQVPDRVTPYWTDEDELGWEGLYRNDSQGADGWDQFDEITESEEEPSSD